MKTNSTGRSERVVASTFHVFIALIEDVHQEQSVITYEPIDIDTVVYDLSNNKQHEIRFDNTTYCHGHSMYSRLCVYTFHTSPPKTIRFFLHDFHYSGVYQNYRGGGFTAGMALLNHFNGTTENIFEVNRNSELFNVTDLEIIGTGNMMYISVFVYSVLASVIIRFTMSDTHCNVLLVSGNHVSYSGYIKPVNGDWHVFKINQLLKTLIEYNVCYRFLFVYDIPPQYTFKILFTDYTPVLVTVHYGFFSHRHKHCQVYFKGPPYQTYPCTLRNYALSRLIYEYTTIRYVKSFEVKGCDRFQHTQLQIKWLPCKLPCHYFNTCYLDFVPKIDNGQKKTCDICNNVYPYRKCVELKAGISLPIQVKTAVCKEVILWIEEWRGLELLTIFNRSNIFVRVPAFKDTTYTYFDNVNCITEIPTTAVLSTETVISTQDMNCHELKVAYLGDVLYYILFEDRKVSWEKAARVCQETGASLLTIYSLAEYKFIKKTFLDVHDTLVLYVGVRKEVSYSHKWLNATISIDWF